MKLLTHLLQFSQATAYLVKKFILNHKVLTLVSFFSSFTSWSDEFQPHDETVSLD